MGAVIVAIWSLVAAAGAALAASAPFGALAPGGQYLAGHVLIGLGLGQLLAAALRSAAKRVVRKASFRTAPATGTAVPAVPSPVPALRDSAADSANVTVLRPRPAAVVPLRSRHAA
ncbi:hypothetical protein [Pseudarthrobacter sp. NamB4]|uniref:hypothetical protein n=1 Tax=Pseudarthrobacter sp. NamB4 TaxID=2576837 RepID=UPI0010FD94E5|nr:hypothetical protein [Pseudarthrobacter sp. NamB4]TLM70307.1 hypothetical protein FDW81_17795 [Pseudarthrobacter sp. NamB4]